MKKRVLSLLLAATMTAALAMAGCGNSSAGAETDSATGGQTSTEDAAGQEAEADALALIQEKGEMTIALEGTWAPWGYHDEDDNLVGYDVEVATKIAEKLGVTPVFVEAEWDGLFAGLDSGRYDMVVNGVEVTEERAEKYDFSDPYSYIYTVVITSEDNEEIASFEDLDGKQTANTLASTYATLAESYGATATGVDDLNQTIELVLNGRVDATLNAEVTFNDYMNVHPDSALKIAARTAEPSTTVIPVKKGAEYASLLAAVNQAIAELQESGELTEISEKYFGMDVSKNTVAE